MILEMLLLHKFSLINYLKNQYIICKHLKLTSDTPPIVHAAKLSSTAQSSFAAICLSG